MLGILNDQNEWCTSEQQKEFVAVEYFQRLFASSNPTRINETLQAVDRTVTQDANYKLLLPFTIDEVRVAFFQMHPSKASGPDGMSIAFSSKSFGM